MNTIYIVKVVAGSYEDRIEKNIKAFENKAKAQEFADELNGQFECIVDLDLYCESEIFVSNDIMEQISTYKDFYTYTKEMVNNSDRYEDVKDLWYLLEGIYAAYQHLTWQDFINTLLYDTEGKPSKDYSYWFAVLLKIFCEKLDAYDIDIIQKSVEIYRETWSQPYAFVEDIEIMKVGD